jgi:PQQ-dependent catabolism-associated beta-propeller protein
MTVSRRICWALLVWFAFSPQASAKGTGYLFVSNEKTNNIVVIDPKQDYRVVKWIETSHRPRAMAFRDDREQVLVACGDDDVIDVIDVATLKVTDHIPTGHSPEVFGLSRDEKTLYVSDKAGSAVEVINVAEKMIEQEIRTGAEPEEIAVSGEEATMYVTSGVSDWVHVIDLEAGVVTDNIVVGTRPGRFLLMPGGKELWVSGELSGQVSIIDRVTNLVSARLDFLPPGSRQADVTPLGMTATKDGKLAFVTLSRANSVAFIDSSVREVQDYVAVGKGPSDAALSADEKTLYVVDGSSDDLSIVDVPTRKTVKAVPVGRAPYAVKADDLIQEPPAVAVLGASNKRR